MNRAAALVGYRALSDAAGKGAFFLVTILAARRLAPTEFGLFSLGTAVGWMAGVASDFGIQMHLARAVAQRPADAGWLLERWWRIRIATAAGTLTTVAAGSMLVGARGSFLAAVILLTSVYLGNALVELLYYYCRGLSRTDLESTLTLGHKLATLACAAAALWLAAMPNVMHLAVAMALPTGATLAIALRLAHRLAPDGAKTNIGRAWAADDWRAVAPIGVGIVLSALYFRIDVVLLQLWSDASAVAGYNAVFRLVEALRLFPSAVLAVAMPALFRADSPAPLLRMATWLTCFAVLVSAGLMVGARWLVPAIYGAPYDGAVPAFRILLAAFPLMALNYALTHQLIGWNGHRAWAMMCAAAVAFNIALNARLIPTLSMAGAAWATLWTELLLTVVCSATLGVETARRRAVAPAGAPVM